MELSSTEVEAVRSLTLPMQESLIIPLGDIQLDPKRNGQERTTDISRLKKMIEWGVEHNAYWLGMGDMADSMSPSNREKLKQAAFYDSVVDSLEAKADETEEELKEMLAPTRGRWLGMLEGHHYHPHEDGTTTDTRLAAYVGCPFLGTSAMVQVKFKAEGKHKPPSFVIWAHHGRGGGGALAAPISQLVKVTETFDADVYLIGHHHKKQAAKIPVIKAEFPERGGKPRLVHKNRIVACTGSYLKAYMEGSKRENRARGGYVEQAMMNPVALGSVVIWARPRYNHDGYAEVDLDVSL